MNEVELVMAADAMVTAIEADQALGREKNVSSYAAIADAAQRYRELRSGGIVYVLFSWEPDANDIISIHHTLEGAEAALAEAKQYETGELEIRTKPVRP